MNSVTAGAGGRGPGAEPDGDAVEAVDEGRDLVLGDAVFFHDFGPGMTSGARIGNVFAENRRFFVRGRSDPVLAVAVHTEGRVDVPGQRLPAVDAFFVFIEDELVAAAAGLGLLGHEVRFADTLDIVDPVAVGADGGVLDEPFLEEGLSVDALHILLVGHFAVDVVLDDDRHVLMAGGTGLGDILAMDGRLGIRVGADVMLAVAIPAPGHLGDAPFQVGPSVDAVRIDQRVEAGFLAGAFTMTGRGAVRRRDILLVGDFPRLFRRLDGVAVGAEKGRVDGGRKMAFVYPQLAGRRRRAVTGETGRVLGGG